MKNFDMMFIFKDYARKPVMISSISMASLDSVKEWLKYVLFSLPSTFLDRKHRKQTQLKHVSLTEARLCFEQGQGSIHHTSLLVYGASLSKARPFSSGGTVA